MLVRQITMSNKIKSYLHKFHLRDIPHGRRLFHMGKADNDKCKWCTNTVESISHLYWHCPEGVGLWQAVVQLFVNIYNIQEDPINLDKLSYLFGIFPNKLEYPKVFNMITGLTR